MAHLFHYLAGIVLRTSKLITFLCTLTYICAFQTSLLPFIISAVLFVIPTNWKASLNVQSLIYYTMRERWNIGCMSRLILLSSLLLGVLLDQWCYVHYYFHVLQLQCSVLTCLHTSSKAFLLTPNGTINGWRESLPKLHFVNFCWTQCQNSSPIIKSTWLSMMERKYCCLWLQLCCFLYALILISLRTIHI